MSDPKDNANWVPFTLALNAGLVLAHVVVFLSTRSRLVLAQGSDSLMDVVAVVVLAISAMVARRPRDDNHPFGHGRAEPVGALLVAALAGVLAFEVGRSAFEVLFGGDAVSIDASVAVVLATKLAAKLVLLILLSKEARVSRSPALRAVVVDARNDLVATGSSLLGYAVVRVGWARADALLALPVCVYIAYNGLRLARENIGYLMGEAPNEEIVLQLRSAASGVDGVVSVSAVAAHFVGSELHVEVTVVVARDASATEAHDVAVAVQRAVEAIDPVARAFIHVDTIDTADRLHDDDGAP